MCEPNHQPKYRVEDCPYVDIDLCSRLGLLDGGEYCSEVFQWQPNRWAYRGPLSSDGLTIAIAFATHRRRARILCQDPRDPDGRLTYRTDVRLSQSELPWGRLRWWFHCSSLADGGNCDRRMRKLYLAPDGSHFACRSCHRLTYRSSVESHTMNRAAKGVVPGVDLSGDDVRKAINRSAKKMQAPGIHRERLKQRRRRRKQRGWS